MSGDECAACRAKDQTILVFADQVDWLRARLDRMDAVAQNELFRPAPELVSWNPTPADEEAEDIIAALEEGAITREAAEEALARIQATRESLSGDSHLSVVK